MTTPTYTEFRQEYASLSKVPKEETTYNILLGYPSVPDALDRIHAEFFLASQGSPEHTDDSDSGNNGTPQHLRMIGRSDFKPPQASVDYAAVWMNNFFLRIVPTNTVDQAYAIAGGVAFRCFNFGDRLTNDVDIYWEGDSRAFLKQAVLTDRFILPHTQQMAFALTMFLKVGPRWGDPLVQENLIKIDMVRGALAENGFWEQTVYRKMYANQKQYDVRVLNVMFLLKGKLRAYADRMHTKDWDDAELLIRRFGEHIQTKQTLSDQRQMTLLQPEARQKFLGRPPPDRIVRPEYIDILCARHFPPLSPSSSSSSS